MDKGGEFGCQERRKQGIFELARSKEWRKRGNGETERNKRKEEKLKDSVGGVGVCPVQGCVGGFCDRLCGGKHVELLTVCGTSGFHLSRKRGKEEERHEENKRKYKRKRRKNLPEPHEEKKENLPKPALKRAPWEIKLGPGTPRRRTCAEEKGW